MVSWILFDRNATTQKPIVSAMQGGDVKQQLDSNLKTDLINFLKQFSGANTFLVAQPQPPNNPTDDELTEAAHRLPEDGSQDNGSTPTLTATWFHFFRDDVGQPVVVAMAGGTGVEAYRGNIKESLIAFLSRHAGANTFQVAPPGESIPNIPIIPIAPLPTLPKHRVLLEVGHGPGTRFDPGAIAPGGTTEHSLNIIAANAARKVLDEAGVFCVVIDTPQGSLHQIGLQAAGFDVFCSVHHNAANRSAQGSEVLVHKTKADAPDRELAKMMAMEMATTLGIRNREVNDRRNLAVLSGAEDTNVKAAVLAEVYFMDVPGLDLNNLSTRGGEAIGQAILNWLENN